MGIQTTGSITQKFAICGEIKALRQTMAAMPDFPGKPSFHPHGQGSNAIGFDSAALKHFFNSAPRRRMIKQRIASLFASLSAANYNDAPLAHMDTPAPLAA